MGRGKGRMMATGLHGQGFNYATSSRGINNLPLRTLLLLPPNDLPCNTCNRNDFAQKLADDTDTMDATDRTEGKDARMWHAPPRNRSGN